MNKSNDIYAEPRIVTDINECCFYHTMDIPGYGTIEGPWDLRQNTRNYLGGVNFNGKRVLEIGTASGFLCFYMERNGAEVVAYDLSDDLSWDIVPFAGYDYTQFAAERKDHIRKLNNAFWLCHRIYKSKAKVVYGTVYAIPEQIGMVDISTFGSVLLHVRDPFLALQNAIRLTRQTVIVTEVPLKTDFPAELFKKLLGNNTRPYMQFLPEFSACMPKETWWCLSPEIIVKFIGTLGFEKSEVKYHTQKFKGCSKQLYTIIGHRTKDV